MQSFRPLQTRSFSMSRHAGLHSLFTERYQTIRIRRPVLFALVYMKRAKPRAATRMIRVPLRTVREVVVRQQTVQQQMRETHTIWRQETLRFRERERRTTLQIQHPSSVRTLERVVWRNAPQAAGAVLDDSGTSPALQTRAAQLFARPDARRRQADTVRTLVGPERVRVTNGLANWATSAAGRATPGELGRGAPDETFLRNAGLPTSVATDGRGEAPRMVSGRWTAEHYLFHPTAWMTTDLGFRPASQNVRINPPPLWSLAITVWRRAQAAAGAMPAGADGRRPQPQSQPSQTAARVPAMMAQPREPRVVLAPLPAASSADIPAWGGKTVMQSVLMAVETVLRGRAAAVADRQEVERLLAAWHTAAKPSPLSTAAVAGTVIAEMEAWLQAMRLPQAIPGATIAHGIGWGSSAWQPGFTGAFGPAPGSALVSSFPWAAFGFPASSVPALRIHWRTPLTPRPPALPSLLPPRGATPAVVDAMPWQSGPAPYAASTEWRVLTRVQALLASFLRPAPLRPFNVPLGRSTGGSRVASMTFGRPLRSVPAPAAGTSRAPLASPTRLFRSARNALLQRVGAYPQAVVPAEWAGHAPFFAPAPATVPAASQRGRLPSGVAASLGSVVSSSLWGPVQTERARWEARHWLFESGWLPALAKGMIRVSGQSVSTEPVRGGDFQAGPDGWSGTWPSRGLQSASDPTHVTRMIWPGQSQRRPGWMFDTWQSPARRSITVPAPVVSPVWKRPAEPSMGGVSGTWQSPARRSASAPAPGVSLVWPRSAEPRTGWMSGTWQSLARQLATIPANAVSLLWPRQSSGGHAWPGQSLQIWLSNGGGAVPRITLWTGPRLGAGIGALGQASQPLQTWPTGQPSATPVTVSRWFRRRESMTHWTQPDHVVFRRIFGDRWSAQRSEPGQRPTGQAGLPSTTGSARVPARATPLFLPAATARGGSTGFGAGQAGQRVVTTITRDLITRRLRAASQFTTQRPNRSATPRGSGEGLALGAGATPTAARQFLRWAQGTSAVQRRPLTRPSAADADRMARVSRRTVHTDLRRTIALSEEIQTESRIMGRRVGFPNAGDPVGAVRGLLPDGRNEANLAYRRRRIGAAGQTESELGPVRNSGMAAQAEFSPATDVVGDATTGESSGTVPLLLRPASGGHSSTEWRKLVDRVYRAVVERVRLDQQRRGFK